MRSILLLFALSLLCYRGFAQGGDSLKAIEKVKITVGKPYKLTKGQPRNYFYDGRYTIALKTLDRRVVTVQCFDTQTNTEVRRNVYTDLPEHEVQPPIKSNGNFYYLYHFYNRQEKTQQLCSRKVNVSQGTLEPPVVICSTSPTVPILYEEDITPILPVHFKVTRSFDSSRVLITYRVKPRTRNDDANFDVWGYHILDRDLKPVWNKEVQMPYVQTKMTKWSGAVTRKDQVYQLLYSSINKYELLIITSDTVQTKLLDFLPKLRPSEFRLDETIDGNILCTCFYTSEILTFTGEDYRIAISSSLDTKAYMSGGLYFAEVSSEGKLMDQGKYKIPFHLLNAYEDEKTRAFNEEKEAKGIAGIRDLKIVNQYFYKDGSSITIGEQQYNDLSADFDYRIMKMPSLSPIRPNTNNGLETSRSIGHTEITNSITYGDLYVIKLDAKHQLLWMKKIGKTQNSINKITSMGVNSKSLNGALYIFYLDSRSNLEIKEDQVAMEGGTLTVCKMSEDTGEYKKYSLGGRDDIKGTTRMLFLMKRVAGNGERSTIEVEAGQDLETTVVFDLK